MRSISRFLHLVEDGVLILLVISMIGLSSAQLVLRNLDVSGLIWSDAALRINVLWLAMFGALRASRSQNHIAIDLIKQAGSVKFRKQIHFLVSVSCAGLCTVAAYYGFLFIQLEIEDGAMAFLRVPVWVCEAIIPFSFLIIAARFLGQAFKPKLTVDRAAGSREGL